MSRFESETQYASNLRLSVLRISDLVCFETFRNVFLRVPEIILSTLILGMATSELMGREAPLKQRI